MLACAAASAKARQHPKYSLPGANEKNAHLCRSLARQRPPPDPPRSMLGMCSKARLCKDERFFHRFHIPQAEQVNIEIGGAKGALTTTALNQ